ncbi:thialysine N-epsilon-acetyltransferase-like isoform X1 [Syngnathus typhle]|uniref:thialysine N-epsilon-acetyltransferase-like isoform X1 n=1 Tax=Syngnathus typhle TaxID=161592 RepID=UPI002A6AF75B|nr:thialysine N-epsilon-acetyltransferase-like isoform X1 [Syngnathus typhle]
MDVKIRVATKGDCKDISRLIMDLAVHDKMSDQVKLSCDELQRDGFSQNPLFECLVAEIADENKSKEGFTIIGYALYFYIYCTWKGRSMYLEDLYVMPEFRDWNIFCLMSLLMSSSGFGIGKSLLSNIAQVAKEKQCARLHLIVLNWNSHSLDFYTARGAQDLTVKEGWHLVHFDGQSLDHLANETQQIRKCVSGEDKVV